MSDINAAVITTRQKKLAQAISNAGLDAVALNPSPSLTYLTGLHFHLSERPTVCLFRADGAPILVLAELESAKARDLPYPLEYFTYGEEPSEWVNAFKQAAQAAGLSRAQIGVEDRNFRLLESRILESALPDAKFISADDVTSSLRLYKDDSEIAAMQKAVDIAEAALKAVLPLVKIGMTEKELASELTMQIQRHGSDPQLPFFPIIASGPNSANPHAFPTQRKLAAGEFVVIDYGASHQGYFSDITRTFAVGEASDKQRLIHETVHQSNQAGIAAAKPGVACSAVDQAARDVIEQAGYGQYFIHRTGHGLGMEGHEAPYMRAGNPMLLETGMTFTVEPGIYLPGQDGVRIEDNVVITADGARSLTSLPRELQIIG